MMQRSVVMEQGVTRRLQGGRGGERYEREKKTEKEIGEREKKKEKEG